MRAAGHQRLQRKGRLNKRLQFVFKIPHYPHDWHKYKYQSKYALALVLLFLQHKSLIFERKTECGILAIKRS